MNTVRVTAVSFANALPLVYGIMHAPERPPMEISLDIPAESAKKMKNGECDLGLMPVGAVSDLDYYEILPGYCIGATGKVRTVRLFSEVPLDRIEKIILDHQSRTSVVLVKVLARHFWKINPTWEQAWPGYEKESIRGNTAAVVIGDKAFGVEHKYPYGYDFAEEWIRYTGLPFVFAAWVANKPMDPEFIALLNKALKYGTEHVRESIGIYPNKNLIPADDMERYLRENISFTLDTGKTRGMNLFLQLAKEL